MRIGWVRRWTGCAATVASSVARSFLATSIRVVARDDVALGRRMSGSSIDDVSSGVSLEGELRR